MSLSSSSPGPVKLQQEEEEKEHNATTTASNAIANDLQDAAATPLSSVTIPAGNHQPEQEHESVLDQHEDDVTQFLNNYTQSARVLDQFDVTRALIQSSQGARGNSSS